MTNTNNNTNNDKNKNSNTHREQTGRRRRRRRVVSFNETVSCLGTLHVNNYTDEEVANTWFTRKEYKEMKREIKVTVGMMDKSNSSSSNSKKLSSSLSKPAPFDEGVNFSARGLEDKTAGWIVQKVEHRFFAMAAVLDEQDQQRDAGVVDPVALSLVYAEYSLRSHMEAFLMGASDEKAALDYYYHHHTSSSSSSSSSSSDDSTQRSSPSSSSSKRRHKRNNNNKNNKESLTTTTVKPYPNYIRLFPSSRTSKAA